MPELLLLALLGAEAQAGDADKESGAVLAGAVDTPLAPPEPAIETEATKAKPSDEAPPNFLFARPAAMTALGNGSGKFDEPGTPEDFAVAVGDFFTEAGGLAPGGAVEVGARALGLTSRVTAARYRESWGLRTLSHSYLSLATTKRAAEVEGLADDVVMGVGFRTTLLHGADALMQDAYAQAVDRTEIECLRLSRAAEASGDASFDPIACRQARYAEYGAQLPTPPWNAGGLVLSGAFTAGWIEGRYRGFQSESVSGWLTGVAPLSGWGQAGLGLGWTQSLTDAPHTLAPTARMRAGFDGARVSVELGNRLSVGGESLDPRWRVVMGGEARVQSQSWVHAEFGLEIAPDQDLVTLLSGVSFRWGQADKPSFMPEG
ncbi:MAG: hypothetical protein H6741_24785 [Alphaproteobacteria bacterium]|nr:hypothetical protein [Alphaproteobacteria bacterium]MCB9795924.1 hypothetical protein [Alphaproteobacteria bacterium]